MKAKTINKKLDFNKLTITNLSDVNGGNANPKDLLYAKTIFDYSCAWDTRCPEVGCI